MPTKIQKSSISFCLRYKIFLATHDVLRHCIRVVGGSKKMKRPQRGQMYLMSAYHAIFFGDIT